MSDSVQQIKDRLNIIDVISPYVELHKAGKNFKGKSPFSAEKTPSFYVSPDRGMYYCFSTSQGGDMFTFIQAMEGVDFKDSLKMLAQKAGVELVPEDPKKRSERERLYAVLDEATKFYAAALEGKKQASEYLKERKVEADTIRTWQIGYAPGPPDGGWREVKEYLTEKGYTNDEMLKAGLIKITEGGKEPFDVFRDRVMFPMRDAGGKTVAYSGRLLTPNDKAPKYVNSPETELYKKSDLLFGYDKAKHGIRTLDFSLIVEGQFDVVMSHQAGYHNTVAVSGTALTLHHVQLLERLSNRVVLALDADRAGIAAMKRAADLMLKRGLDVKVAEMPEGKDPADLVAEGKDALKKVVGKSVHVIEFLLHVLKRTEDDARTLKLRAREEVLPFILLLPNRIDQEHFVEIVAKEIGSSNDAIRFELDRLREDKAQQRNVADLDNDVLADKNVAGVDTVHKAYTYLLAAKDLLESGNKMKLVSELQTVIGDSKVEEPDTKDVAEAVFVLERQFDTLPKLATMEEIVSKLNLFKISLAKRHLRQLREEMELVGESEQLTLLARISEWEEILRQEPYRADTLFGKKD